jgi:hypothetical protein
MTDLYEVQMYSSLRGFLVGWIRLLRLGLRYTSVVGFIEILLVLRLFAGTGSPYVFVPAMALLAWVQRQHGAFSVWGAILAPLSVFLFIALSSIGAVQALMRKKVIWHDRAYIGS